MLKPRQILDIAAPLKKPKLKEDLKIGLRIFLVLSSIMATCVKIFGACIPIEIPQNIETKIKIL